MNKTKTESTQFNVGVTCSDLVKGLFHKEFIIRRKSATAAINEAKRRMGRYKVDALISYSCHSPGSRIILSN